MKKAQFIGTIKGLLVILCLSVFFASSSNGYAANNQKSIVTVFPKETNEVLHNPDMGWVLIDNAITGHVDMGRTGTYPEVDNVAILSCWSELEPTEGNYNWTLVDQAIEYWKDQGKRIHFRISTDAMIISAYNFVGGVPDWLFDQYNVPYQERYDQGLTFKLPDYTHAIYKEKLQSFLTAFANKYKNNPYLDIVDLRGYGTWGEWHSGHDFNSYEERKEALKEIIDAWYTAWGESKILAISNSYEWRNELTPAVNNPSTYEEYLTWSAFDYALTKNKLTIRRDGAGGALRNFDTKLLKDFHFSNRNLPIICEFFAAYDKYAEPGGTAGFTADTALDEALMYNPNYITIMGHDGDNSAANFYNERPDLVEKGNKLMGYRLVLTKASYPNIVQPGESFTLEQDWINVALGRCYNKYPLKVSLTDSSGQEVWSSIDQQFDQRAFVRGELYTVASQLQLSDQIPEGTYDLKISMVDSSGNSALMLAIDGKDADNRYKIGTITVGTETEGFETGSFEEAGYVAGFNNYGKIVNDSDKIITGQYSVLGDASNNNDWYEFLYTEPTKIKLEGGASYKVTFKYKTILSPNADGFHYFLARTKSGGFNYDKGFNTWNNIGDHTVKEKTITITLADFDDYYLIWGLKNGGQMIVDDIVITKTGNGFGEGFESGTLGRYKQDSGSSGQIVQGSQKVINGVYTYNGIAPSTTEWCEYLLSDKEKMTLEGGVTYKVTFKYKVNNNQQNNHYYFLARSANGGYSHDKGVTRWLDDKDSIGIKTIVFTLDNFDDYNLIWGIKNGGDISIDDINVKKLNQVDYENFEEGHFDTTKYYGGYNASGSIDSTNGTVIQGDYSVYCNGTSNEWLEYLHSTNDLKLKPNTTYSITFKYKPCVAVGNGGYYYFVVRSATGGVASDIGFTQWMDKVGVEPKYKSFVFTTGGYEDYYLIWGIHNNGGISIDDITLVEEK